MAERVPPEPSPGTDAVLHTRVRFPDGSRMSRNFRITDPIDVSLLIDNVHIMALLEVTVYSNYGNSDMFIRVLNVL